MLRLNFAVYEVGKDGKETQVSSFSEEHLAEADATARHRLDTTRKFTVRELSPVEKFPTQE